MKNIHWEALALSLANWIVGGGLTTILPEKYKPLGAALILIVQTFLPSVKKAAPSTPVQFPVIDKSGNVSS
jgi:hypothetical protein